MKWNFFLLNSFEIAHGICVCLNRKFKYLQDIGRQQNGINENMEIVKESKGMFSLNYAYSRDLTYFSG